MPTQPFHLIGWGGAASVLASASSTWWAAYVTHSSAGLYRICLERRTVESRGTDGMRMPLLQGSTAEVHKFHAALMAGA